MPINANEEDAHHHLQLSMRIIFVNANAGTALLSAIQRWICVFQDARLAQLPCICREGEQHGVQHAHTLVVLEQVSHVHAKEALCGI